MSKTILEKRIEERATERFDREFKEFVDYIVCHPIGKHLTVRVGDKKIPVANFGQNYGLFNNEGIKSKYSDNTNLREVREQTIEKYKKEETDELLERIDSIGYLFSQN